MFCIRLFARRSVWRRLRRGRLPSVMIALSVKSMASCWSFKQDLVNIYQKKRYIRTHTRATPRFSIAGIL